MKILVLVTIWTLEEKVKHSMFQLRSEILQIDVFVQLY